HPLYKRSAELLASSAGCFPLLLHQFSCQRLCDVVPEVTDLLASGQRTFDGFYRLWLTEVLQMKAHAEFLRHDRGVLIDRGDIIFAHGKQRPNLWEGIKRVAHLQKEPTPLMQTIRVGSKQIFNLIENFNARLGKSFVVYRLITA